MDVNNPIQKTEVIGILKKKDKMEKDKSTVKPTVINDMHIRNYLIKYNKENNIFDQNQMPLWEIENLSLQFKNILQISNLTGMEKLQKLQLDNNIIIKIENLDNLINLKWLDLSFNRITKIEGLDKLIKLQDLSLYDNKVQAVEGLENLSELNVLSIGNNLLKNHEEVVTYLMNLKNKLQVIKMSDNPWSYTGQTEQTYLYYTIEVLKNLQYIDYILIDEEMRKMAFQKHGEALNELLNANAEKKKGTEEEIDPEFLAAHIGCTVGMLDKILASCESAQKLLGALSRFADLWGTFQEAVMDPMQTYQAFMNQNHKKKENIIVFCGRKMREEELDAEKRSIELLDQIKGLKKHTYRDMMENNSDRMNMLEETEKSLIKSVDKLEDDLMNIEMLLQDALQTAQGDFKDKTHDINKQLKDKTNEHIKFVIEQASEFQKAFFVYAVEEQAKFEEFLIAQQANNQEFDDDEEFNNKLAVMGDKDDTMQMLEDQTEFIEKAIQEREGMISKAINEEAREYERTIEKQQKQRNRNIVRDIITTCNDYRSTIKDDINNMRGEEEDA